MILVLLRSLQDAYHMWMCADVTCDMHFADFKKTNLRSQVPNVNVIL